MEFHSKGNFDGLRMYFICISCHVGTIGHACLFANGAQTYI